MQINYQSFYCREEGILLQEVDSLLANNYDLIIVLECS
jgi:hypothetical protein